jgi:hypothetical protein
MSKGKHIYTLHFADYGFTDQFQVTVVLKDLIIFGSNVRAIRNKKLYCLLACSVLQSHHQRSNPILWVDIVVAVV